MQKDPGKFTIWKQYKCQVSKEKAGHSAKVLALSKVRQIFPVSLPPIPEEEIVFLRPPFSTYFYNRFILVNNLYIFSLKLLRI